MSSNLKQNWTVNYNILRTTKEIDIQLVHVLQHDRDRFVTSVALSRDGTLLATGFPHFIHIYKTSTGEEVCEINTMDPVYMNGETDVRSLCFSPDGKYIANGGDNKCVMVWHIASQTKTFCFDKHSEDVDGIVFSNDGRFIAFGSRDGNVRYWDTMTGRCVLFHPSPAPTTSVDTAISSVAISPDNCFIAASILGEAEVRIWEISSGKELEPLSGHQLPVWDTTFTNDGHYLITGSLDTSVKIWDFASHIHAQLEEAGDDVSRVRTLVGHDENIFSVKASPDNRWIISASGDRTVRFWDISTGELHVTLESPADRAPVLDACADSNGATGLLAAAGDAQVILWRFTTIK